MSKIHLTGATGYLGALLTKYLEVAGHLVEKASYRLPDVPAHSIDADLVIHLAVAGGGTAHKPRAGFNDPKLTKQINIDGMRAILSGIKNSDAKVILMSSTAVYGKFDDSRLVNEETKLLPVSNYGQDKVETENILINSNFDWLILRPCGIFGPSVNNKFGNSFLNVVIENVIRSKEMTIMGGKQEIDTLYILDLIQVVLRICSSEWQSREIYNVGGEIVKVEKMLNILHQSLQEVGIVCSVNSINFEGKPAVMADTLKLKKILPGWKNTPLEYAFYSLVSSYIRQYSV